MSRPVWEETYSTHGLKVGGSLVLEVGRVGNLAGSPRTLVGRVVNQRSAPLALVGRVLLQRGRPGTTSRDFVALGIGDRGRDPVTILLVIPVFGLLSLGVRDAGRLVLQPVIGNGGILIDDLEGRLLIPVLGLLGFGVRDLGLIDPVSRLLVLGVVDLLGRVDRGVEVVNKGAVLDGLAVNEDLEGLVGPDDQGVEGGDLGGASGRGSLEVLLLVLAGLGVLVTENEVNLAKSVSSSHSSSGLSSNV